MSDEKKQQIHVFVRAFIILVCAGLYAWGGMEMKWLRRYLAPTICVGTMFAYTRDWRCFIQLGPWFGALSMGYGGVETWVKVLKRGVYGLLNGVVSSGKNLSDAIRGDKRMWILFGAQIFLCVFAYILYGVWNPWNGIEGGARIEEFTLGLTQFTIPLISANRRKTL